MEVVTKVVLPMKDKVIPRMDRMLYQYAAEMGRGPAAFLLGPVEFLSFLNEIHGLSGIPFKGIQGQYEYKGFPIEVMRKPGLDLMINKSDAFQLAPGMLRKPEPPRGPNDAA